MLHNRLHGGLGVSGREQLVTDAAGVAAGFEVADHLGIVDFAGTRLVAARCVGNVDMSELVAVLGNGIANAAFINLHVVYIVKQLQARGANQAADFRAHLGGGEEVADMVGGDVERLKVEVDFLPLGKLGAFEQHVVH